MSAPDSAAAFREDPRIEAVPDDTVVWRFMGLDKYLSLLSGRALYLARADQMVDPWEGVWPEPRSEDAPQQASLPKIITTLFGNFRQSTYLSCWFASEQESAAMWTLYASENNGVALRTTWGALTRALRGNDHDVVGGRVKYVTYQESPPDRASPYDLFFFKRLSFKHEEEVRLMVMKNISSRPDGTIVIRPAGREILGLPVEMDLEGLNATVYVSPKAAGWFLAAVRSVTNQYGLSNWHVQQSKLYSMPW